MLTLTAPRRGDLPQKNGGRLFQEAFDTASIAAQLIDGDRIAEYRKTLKKDALLRVVHQTLQMIRQSTGVKYLYVVIPEDVQFTSGIRAKRATRASVTWETRMNTTATAMR